MGNYHAPFKHSGWHPDCDYCMELKAIAYRIVPPKIKKEFERSIKRAEVKIQKTKRKPIGKRKEKELVGHSSRDAAPCVQETRKQYRQRMRISMYKSRVDPRFWPDDVYEAIFHPNHAESGDGEVDVTNIGWQQGDEIQIRDIKPFNSESGNKEDEDNG